MSLAEEMLATMSASDDSSTYLSEEEPHIIIDNSRTAFVPSSLKTIAVAGDHEVEKITFDCVRFWDGNDLSTFAIYLNYVLPDLSTGTYIPSSIVADNNVFHFDWDIKNNITKKSGKIAFAITAIKTKKNDSGETVVDKQWSSIPNGDCSIALGIDISNVPSEEESSDVLAQMSAILEQIQSNIVQTTGQSTTAAMSQKAATDNFALKSDLTNVSTDLQNVSYKTDAIGYDTTVNLCNPNTIVDGKYAEAQYNHVGNQIVFNTKAAFAYTSVEVTNGKTYTVSRNDHMLMIVDDDGKVLQIASSGTTITVDSADAKYLYVSFRTANVSIDQFMIVEGSNLPSAFVPHLENLKFIYPSVYAEKTDISNLDNRVKNVETATGVISYERTVNLADPNTAVDNKYIEAKYERIGDPLVEGDNTAFAYNRIEVTTGKTYTVSLNSHRLIVADENGIVLQTLSNGETTITVNTSAAKYLYVSFRTASVPIDRYMIVEGSTLPSEFEPYYKNVGFKYPTKYGGIEYIVDINGSGDYTSLTECLKDLKDNADKKTIKILSGTYDIFEEYGGAEFVAEVDVETGWRENSVLIPKNTHLLGIGQVILKWEPDPEDIIDDEHANLFSPINLSDDNITIENVEIICSNGRYCIHDECGVRWEDATAKFQKITHKYINVRAIRTAKTYGNVQAYGGGSSAEGMYVFENCLFSSPLTNVWSTHANSNNVQGNGGCKFIFNNCIFDTDTPSGGTVRFINGEFFKNKNNVSFNSCYINGDIMVTYSGSGSEAVADRKQTYDITALKTTVNEIVIDGEYGSAPYTPKSYS